MARSQPRFTHTRLASDRPQIRLLKLLPQISDDDGGLVVMSLETFDMDTAPPYVAVSYEWGPTDNPKMVIVNDRLFSIRRNLHDFFNACITVDDIGNLLWIDQISINQNDLEERSQQVTLMADIYSHAEIVVAWLGWHPQAEIAFEGAAISTALADDEDTRHRLILWQGAYEEISDLISREHFESFLRLCRLTYWGRTWVAQELILAQACTVMYGHHLVDLEDLTQSPLPGAAHGDYEPFNRLLNLLSNFKNSKVLPEDLWNRAMSLSESSNCDDPRDKYYGIQSMLPEKYRIRVDYGLKVREVYFRVAEHRISLAFQHGRKTTASFIDAGLGALTIAMGLRIRDAQDYERDIRLRNRLADLEEIFDLYQRDSNHYHKVSELVPQVIEEHLSFQVDKDVEIRIQSQLLSATQYSSWNSRDPSRDWSRGFFPSARHYFKAPSLLGQK